MNKKDYRKKIEELGDTNPTVEKLTYILEALGISLKQFFDDSKDDGELVLLINKLNDEEKENIYNLIKLILNNR